MDLAGLLGYRRRWQLLSLVCPRPISSSAPIVIGGCHRSGTTLLRVLLGRHPKIAGGYESTVFLSRISSPKEIGGLFDIDPDAIAAWQRQSRTQVEFIERFEAAVLAAQGREVWAEKTPGNVLRFDFVRRHFPKARLIHIVRDGRDVVCSMRRQRWPKPCGKPGSAAELRRCAEYWARYVTTGRRFAADPLYFEVHYEELVRNPGRVLRELLKFLELDWSEELLTDKPGDPETRELGAVDTAAMGTWRDELSSVEKQIVCGSIGQLLIDLGYESDLGWGGGTAPRSPGTGQASPHFDKRWTRAERMWIELIALWRTVRDPRLSWWPRLTGAALATLYLVSPIDTLLDRIPLVGALADLVVLTGAVALAAMLAPALLRAKRAAIKRARAAREELAYPMPRPPPRPA